VTDPEDPHLKALDKLLIDPKPFEPRNSGYQILKLAFIKGSHDMGDIQEEDIEDSPRSKKSSLNAQKTPKSSADKFSIVLKETSKQKR